MCAIAQSERIPAENDSLPSLETFLSKLNAVPQTADEGLRYLIHSTGKGASPKQGEYVLLRFTAMLTDSTVFDRSEEAEPFIFQVGNREVVKGLDKAVQLMKKGGKATFFIPPSLGYKEFGVGKTVPPNAALIYDLELTDVMDAQRYDAYMRDFEERQRLAYELQEREQSQKDVALIEEYAASHQLKIRRTASGLGYALTKPGKGAAAKPGNRLRVQYEGTLTDGTPIEKTPKTKPYEFTLGSGRVLDGWEEGLQFFNKGSEGWLLVPSKLAYGRLAIDEASTFVPANSVLVFKIKVLEIFER